MAAKTAQQFLTPLRAEQAILAQQTATQAAMAFLVSQVAVAAVVARTQQRQAQAALAAFPAVAEGVAEPH